MQIFWNKPNKLYYKELYILFADLLLADISKNLPFPQHIFFFTIFYFFLCLIFEITVK